jgi:hypothetical protein
MGVEERMPTWTGRPTLPDIFARGADEVEDFAVLIENGLISNRAVADLDTLARASPKR